MANPNLSFASAIVSSLADLGLEQACISPGSRNTPLIAAFAGEPRIQTWRILDERSAGFFALGLARATGRAVALACTSGTAAAEYHPAVVEASQSDVPLIVLTADRPSDVRELGAPQTIDQVALYGSSARFFIDAEPPTTETLGHHGADLAIAAWLAATTGIPGPAHLNLQFREPLLDAEPPIHHVPIDLPPTEAADSPNLSDIAERFDGRNGIIVAGRSIDPEFPEACAELAAVTGFPILADPLSGLRYGPHPQNRVLSYGDALTAAGALDVLPPDLVVRFGPVPTSKPTWEWLARHPEVEQILVDIAGRDASQSATTTLAIPPTLVARALADVVDTAASPDWIGNWRRLDDDAAAAIAGPLTAAPFPNEPQIARIVMDQAPESSAVTLGSSMPIRDADTFGEKSARPIRVFGNRGANGIDGVISAALGSAATGNPALALVGDIAMFHDLNAFGTAMQTGLPLTIVVVNNDGGGIFHFLPQHDPKVLDAETFEMFLGTPHGTDFVAVARSLGMVADDVDDATELADLIAATESGPRLIQLRTNRDDNLRLHRKIAAAVRAAVDAADLA